MRICKVCRKKITFLSEILLCNECNEDVHIKCALINPWIVRSYQIPTWAVKTIKVKFPRIKLEMEGWMYNGKICSSCTEWLKESIPLFIIEETNRLDEEERQQVIRKIRAEKEIKMKECRRARDFEIALNFDNAIEIYEKYEMWKEAGRCRRLQQKEKSPHTKVDIGKIDHSTSISDSVIQRSSVGGQPQKMIQICPYCGEQLNFPKPPKFCPYCKEQIIS